jgi:GNAT superfamily N-acetyltransferase
MSETHQVTLDDGTEVSYIIRGLIEQEVHPWAEFCASVFSYKASPPPPDYFQRHYSNDPDRDASLIRVAVCGTDIVASCRIFLRTVSTGKGGSIQAGGIGEVCTSDSHRRRGLSKVLLENAIRIMNHRKLQLSLLHAAPTFFPVYQKTGGYSCTTSHWSIVSILSSQLKEAATDSNVVVRAAQFPNDTERLAMLHQAYSTDRFAGCIVRTHAYWNEYLSKELQGSLLWVLENNKDDGLVVAWLSIRPRGGRYQLQEFGVDREQISTTRALSQLLLLKHTVTQEEGVAAMPTSEGTWDLALPTAVLDQMRPDKAKASFINWSTEALEDDLGWMYKTLDQGGQVDMNSIITKDTPHLIWPADSF